MGRVSVLYCRYEETTGNRRKMKTLIFVLVHYWLRFFFGVGMLVCAIGFYVSYVPTPADVPFESLGDMAYPWFPIAEGAVGLWCIVSAWLKAAKMSGALR